LHFVITTDDSSKIFVDDSRHITRLNKENVPFEWTDECQNALDILKLN